MRARSFGTKVPQDYSESERWPPWLHLLPGIGLLCILQYLHYGIRARVEHHGSPLSRRQNLGRFLFVLSACEQVSAMKLEREIRIFEQVAGQDQNHGFVFRE